MTLIKNIDSVVNFIPTLPTKIIDKVVEGPSALALLPIAILGYGAGCVAQGAAAAYATYHSSNNATQAILVGSAVTLVPPVTKLLSLYSRHY